MTNSEVTFHVVTVENHGLLECVDEDVFDHPVNAELLREFLANPANVLAVAVADSMVVGMATALAYVHPDKPRSLFVNEVGVSCRYRRIGIGKQLVATVLDWGRQRGCVEAWVATEIGNDAARCLYKSTGGIEDAEHAIVYVYPLTSG